MDYFLTLYFYPSPHGVDWRSPLHLTRSVVRNALSFKPRTIGHVSILLEGKGERYFTGMAAINNNDNRRLILIEQMGLGVLFHQVPGYAEGKDKLDPELVKRLVSGKFSFLKIRISEASFLRTKQYLHEYAEKKVAKWYGLPLRPRHEEGAGCSAFAASVLEVAGVMEEEFKKNWTGQVRVPSALMGELNGRKVPIWKLLIPSKLNRRWATKEEPGRDIFFWDPDLMHAWAKKTWSALQKETRDRYQTVREQNTIGIVVDSSKIVPTDESFWLN